MRTVNYSDYTSRICGLIGIPYSGLNDAELDNLKGYFDTAVREMWQANTWKDVCPCGEARYGGSLLTYMNVMENAVWTATNMTAADDSLLNPVDGRTNASLLSETSTSGLHRIAQTVNQVPSTNYVLNWFLFPNGRRYLYLWAIEATSGTSHYCVFDTQLGSVYSTSSNTGDSGAINQSANGFYLCQLSYTSGAYGTAGATVTVYAGTSDSAVSNPSSASFAGSASKGFYSWGPGLFQVSNAGPQSALIAWEQPGESVIEMLLNGGVYASNPSNVGLPRPLSYNTTTEGIQVLGTQTSSGYWNYPITTANTSFGYQFFEPLFLWYRKECPSYQGDDYDAGTAYAVDDQILFEDSDGVLNFYKCTTATVAGYSPENQPTYWALLEIPEVFFLFAVYFGYAQWLIMDGQMEKAQAAENRAKRIMDSESDKQERQMGISPPMVVQSYVTSQSRF